MIQEAPSPTIGSSKTRNGPRLLWALSCAGFLFVVFVSGCSRCGCEKDPPKTGPSPLARAERIYAKLSEGVKESADDPVLAAGYIQGWIAEHAEELARLFGKISTKRAATRRVIAMSTRARKAVRIPEFEKNEDFRRAALAFHKLNRNLITYYMKRLEKQQLDLQKKIHRHRKKSTLR